MASDGSELFERADRVPLLHLACHASRDGILLSKDGGWTTPLDLLDLTVRADVLPLTACNAGGFSTTDNNEFLGVVRQLLVATEARTAIVSAAPVAEVAASLFADLFASAWTGRSAPGRPWNPPPNALTAGASVEWARGMMRSSVRRLFVTSWAEAGACSRSMRHGGSPGS